MPSYKTHSIHGEVVLPQVEKKVDVDVEDVKSYCMGPDAMISTDYKTFDYQHANKVREYFTTMFKLIKSKRLQDNSETIAFLYGHISHYVLDLVMHPLIYYMTEKQQRKSRISPHSLSEMWLDNYVIQKYGKNDLFYYRKLLIRDRKLMRLINELYKRVYKVDNESYRYSMGMLINAMFDSLARRNLIGITPLVSKAAGLGEFTYNKNYSRIRPILNLDKKVWFDPETGEAIRSSFDDLWAKSIDIALETINDINNYIYQDKPISNPLILNDVSYNTGLPCEKGQSLKYVKKY